MEWIACSDRMPEVGERVLMYSGHYVIQGSYRSNKYAKTERGREPRFEGFHGINHGVTHWMPLPPPPTE